jgi:hypothetical protein
MSRARFTAAQLHGTALANALPAKDKAALGIESADEMNARVERIGERELQRQCEQLLRLRGIPYVHIPSRAKHSAGWPDLTFPRPSDGKFVGVELKTKTGKLSEDQCKTLAKLMEYGAFCKVCRTFDEFRAVLDG